MQCSRLWAYCVKPDSRPSPCASSTRKARDEDRLDAARYSSADGSGVEPVHSATYVRFQGDKGKIRVTLRAKVDQGQSPESGSRVQSPGLGSAG